MARFDSQIATALRLIAKNGQSAVWTAIENVIDPAKPWAGGESVSVAHDVTICFLPINRDQAKTYTVLTGTEVPSGSVMAYMGNVPFTPKIKDTVTRDGVVMRIGTLDVLSPNGQKILYTAVLIP